MANEKTKVEIKGYTRCEVCNSKSEELIKKYTPLNERLIRIYNEIKKLEKEREEIRNEVIKLRKEEVNNVLDYVRGYKDILKPRDIDTYLCHCQNMLNGNIDGTFLSFRDPTKDNKNEN